jgi:fructosamine-3-kinase
MDNLTTIQNWLNCNNFGEIEAVSPISGGCINETARISLVNAGTVFVKQHKNPPPNFFAAEAAGLKALRGACNLKVPQVLHVDREFLLLEDLGNSSATADFWSILGEGLAEVHQQVMPSFGFETDNYCGSTPQANPITTEGYDFFAHHRLLALANTSVSMGYLTSSEMNALEHIATNLSEWIPAQPAVLIHGDLWSGNVHSDKQGLPALIDPACYWGWAEAELAMTALFGGFNQEFYRAYESASGISVDWRERAALYNLYHLLNHLILFGQSYHSQVSTIIKRFGNIA